MQILLKPIILQILVMTLIVYGNGYFKLNCSNLILSTKPSVLIVHGNQDKDILLEYMRNCLPNLGRQTSNYSSTIWNNIVQMYGGIIENIPQEIYGLMGWIVNGIAPEHIDHIAMNNIEIVKIFGIYHGLSEDQMIAITNKIRNDYKTPEQYSQYDLMALGQILCHLNEPEFQKIHADAYKSAALSIGTLTNCTPKAIRQLANLAIQPDAFGMPNKWTKLVVDVIGIVVTGLTPEYYSMIPIDSLLSHKRLFGKQINETWNEMNNRSNCSK